MLGDVAAASAGLHQGEGEAKAGLRQDGGQTADPHSPEGVAAKSKRAGPSARGRLAQTVAVWGSALSYRRPWGAQELTTKLESREIGLESVCKG